MLKTLPLILTAALALGGCATISNSGLNPLNWFGPSTPVAAVQPGAEVPPLVPQDRQTQAIDRRGLIDTVTQMQVERTPNGAVVRATGVGATQGQFNAQLVPTGVQDGTLRLAFRVARAAGSQANGPTATRQVTVARALDFADLNGVRRIQITAAQNSRVSSR